MTRPLLLTDAEVESLGDGEALIRDDMFPSENVRSCALDLDGLHARGRLSLAGMGRGRVHNQAGRSDQTIWANDVEAELFVGLAALFDDIGAQLNESAWLGLDTREVQLALYRGDGGHYVRHRDALAGSSPRRATVIVYLNPDWVERDGGCLRVHPPSGRRDIAPLGGRLVIFLSDKLEHQVLPCHAVRRAATAWYRG